MWMLIWKANETMQRILQNKWVFSNDYSETDAGFFETGTLKKEARCFEKHAS